MELRTVFNWSDVSTDIVLKDDGKEFHAHKMVLIAASPFFKKLFGGQFAEANKNEIQLHLPGHQLNTILDVIYSPAIKPTIINVVELYVDADYLEMTTLQNSIKASLSNYVTSENVFSLITKAISYQQDELITIIKEKLKTLWNVVCSNPEALEVSPEIIYEVITSEIVRNKMPADDICASMINYLAAYKTEERTISLFSNISYDKISVAMLRKLEAEMPNLVLPLNRLIEVVEAATRKVCTECKQEVAVDSDEHCKVIRTHESWEGVYIGTLRVNACCKKLNPCTVVCVPHKFA